MKGARMATRTAVRIMRRPAISVGRARRLASLAGAAGRPSSSESRESIPGVVISALSICSPASPLETDPRIDHEVEEIHDQVEEDHAGRDDQDRALNHGVVPMVDGVDDELSHAGRENTCSTTIVPPRR